ncbi:hypothetical protein [Streptomyces radicis]|uniref:Uncharacterized protein n=1 Tax=Streptomyces radicis TaxID=1750517 RepID=A0A3A9W6N4_9ACTN|nr:hypothetical protein [Streptomyces radicis]RKN04944.1 hypothetical protein D7319_26530 [Streptomyces radicis]RKN16353.1 hypothetical protein D7318_26255 [Streptomyces radicis]
MRLFRRGAGAKARRAVPYKCDFCEKAGDPASFTERNDALGRPGGYACPVCVERYDAFAANLRWERAPGQRPWLRPDAGTEHLLMAGRAPFNAVHAVIDGFRYRIKDVPRATARVAVAGLDLHGGGRVARCESRDDTVRTLSRMIAMELARHHESVTTLGGGHEWVRYTVGLFGDGHGVLLSRTTTEGEWLAQYCFLVEFDDSVHPCVAWHS